MTKKEEWSCSCGCNSWGRIVGVSLPALCVIISIITCLLACWALFFAQRSYEVSKASYNLNVLSAGWEENFKKMNDLYTSEAYINYATEQTNGYIDSFMSAYGDTAVEDGDAVVEDGAVADGSSSLDTLKSIAIGLWTDETALQTCIDEWRYIQAVNDMMNQGNQLFGINGTPGNVIVDRETGNYILVSGAYPVDEFVNAINEYKEGAENYTAWGEEIKNVVEDMLKATPIRGDKDARFTIIEYTELLCPYCQRHSQEWTINSVIEQFPGEVNSVSRHFIIHGDEALQLSAAMECVGEINPDAYHKVFEEAFAKWL